MKRSMVGFAPLPLHTLGTKWLMRPSPDVCDRMANFGACHRWRSVLLTTALMCSLSAQEGEASTQAATKRRAIPALPTRPSCAASLSLPRESFDAVCREFVVRPPPILIAVLVLHTPSSADPRVWTPKNEKTNETTHTYIHTHKYTNTQIHKYTHILSSCLFVVFIFFSSPSA